MNFKNYIFDMDGTIWDSAIPSAKGFTKAVQARGLKDKVITVADIHANFGKTLDDVAVGLMPELPREEAIDITRDCVKQQYVEMDNCVPEIVYPGFVETLEELKARGCNLYIISNCLDGYIDMLFANMDVEKYFDDVAWFRHPMNSKAENIKAMVEKHKMENVCYVGDIQGDFEASNKAGVAFIHAAYGYGKVPDAKYVIHEFSDLVK